MISALTLPFNVLSDLVYPNLCKSCGDMMTGSNLVCGTCLNKLRQTQFGNWIKSMSCSEGIDAAFSCWFFDDELQQVIHLLKYSDYAGVGTQLGKLMGKTIQVDNIREIDMLIPIPLHTVKKRKRGYNQADFIAKGLSTSWNCPVRTDVLRRTKFTESQTQLNKQERIQNLADAIVVRRNVKDKTIVLIDDVLTTGSTMSSAAIALKKCGTKKVIALTCATPRPTEKT